MLIPPLRRYIDRKSATVAEFRYGWQHCVDLGRYMNGLQAPSNLRTINYMALFGRSVTPFVTGRGLK